MTSFYHNLYNLHFDFSEVYVRDLQIIDASKTMFLVHSALPS